MSRVPVAIMAAVVGISILLSACGRAPEAQPGADVQIEDAVNEMENGTEASAPEEGPLLDLIGAGKIEAIVSGSSIESVSLDLHNLSPSRVRVLIPAGTFFAANDASAQSMIVTTSREYDLGPDQELSVSIDTACADLPLDIPDSGNTFTIAQAPPQQDLTRIAPFLGAESYDVRQAAVWIITDDADYYDLGVLVTGGYGGGRVIDAHDAARAMQILESAGIDVRTRSIWGDRHMLSEALPEGELRTWLKADP